jgi:hypothetical protein
MHLYEVLNLPVGPLYIQMFVDVHSSLINAAKCYFSNIVINVVFVIFEVDVYNCIRDIAVIFV